MNNTSHALGDYLVGQRIASGGFGSVFSGEAPDGKQVAIKYERTYSNITRPYLQHEADVYRLLEGSPCVPVVYAYGREERWNIMVFDLLGPSLQALFVKCGRKFSLKTTVMLATQIIECVEYVHSKGIVHRDIKPDNFLMGLNSSNSAVHIVDFGLARRFRHPETLEHFPYFEGHDFFGTTTFASINSQCGYSQSRRDDLESAAYTLILFLRGRLPWQSLSGGTQKHRSQRVKDKKSAWTASRLCEGLPEEFATFLDYAKSLDYGRDPDYGYLKDLFRGLSEREGFEPDFVYDWLSDPKGSESGSLNEDSPDSDNNEIVQEKNVPAIEDADYPTDGDEIAHISVQQEDNVPDVAPGGVEAIVAGAEPESSRSNYDATSICPSPSEKPSPMLPSVQKGDYILIKILPRPTLEYEELWQVASSGAETDNSYWHNPSLSKGDWKFPWRPALVLDANVGRANTRLFLLPLMCRPNGLEDIPLPRRQSFFRIRSGASVANADNEASADDALEVVPTPAFPLENAYHYHQYEVFKILVPTEEVRKIEVQWRLDEEQLERVDAARDKMVPARLDTNIYPSDGEDTQFVKRRYDKSYVTGQTNVFGEVMSLTRDALLLPDVELRGSNGWLPEYCKVEKRRNEENGFYTTCDDDDDDDDDENVSMYTGPSPGNRRLSCTLAIEPEFIVKVSTAGLVEGVDAPGPNKPYVAGQNDDQD
ncbi:hypothetical protein M0805_004078 [Coniferiporia weirii]|nr:hypothetical protein M0805_004078 [Coniferiporia weirii]